MAEKVIAQTTASIYRKEIATGKGWVGSGSNKKEVTLSAACIEQRKQKLAAYDAVMATRGTTRTRKWAKQLQSTTNDIKKDTSKLVVTTEEMNERTKVMMEKQDKFEKQLAAYAEKVQVHTQE